MEKTTREEIQMCGDMTQKPLEAFTVREYDKDGNLISEERVDIARELRLQRAREAGRKDRRPLKYRTDMQGGPVE